MNGPHSETEGSSTRPISVAELLAKNGTIGAPAVTRRRRRRRGDSDAVTVAELTGDIPVIRDDHEQPGREADGNPAAAAAESPAARQGELATGDQHDLATGDQHDKAYWSEPEPRWPKSPPQPARVSGPERSAYPRPVRQADEPDTGQQSGAEEMSPDPVGEYAGMPVDVMDTEVRDAELDDEDSAFVRSYLHDSTLFGGQTLADELARQRRGTGAGESDADRDAGRADVAAEERPNEAGVPGRLEALWRGSVVVVQSILAVAFGAALFIAFDQLWRWNSIVALVLSVLVILGLVAGVRVVRKTEDIASTLIAVVVGALITLGPLALSLQSG